MFLPHMRDLLIILFFPTNVIGALHLIYVIQKNRFFTLLKLILKQGVIS